MSLRVAVLGSGSSGNCTFLATDRVRILIDAGLSQREIARRLVHLGERLEAVQAIVVSHEHTDHVNSLGRLAKQYRIPVYISPLTQAALSPQTRLPAVETFQPGCRFQIADLTVEPFTIPHDAVDPVAFRFTAAGVQIALATDLGYLPANVKDYLRGCHGLIVESNHDLEMLRNGPYPWFVKQRVMSREGHLSNSALSDYLRNEYGGEAQVMVLAHLSQQNNHPQIARMEAAEALEQCKAQRNVRETRLVVSSQEEPTEIFRF
ncbi:MAG: MBL fold metallo-hydrolase [Acidobacteria bacterium]|nr:MBL fold metallo-hydrolase [Acidobacteriota bacterium]